MKTNQAIELTHTAIEAITANVQDRPLHNSLDTPTLDKCPNKELEATVINDTENIMQILNLQIQDITTELEAIKMFVQKTILSNKILSILFLAETDNQSEPQRNKEFIELLQQENKT